LERSGQKIGGAGAEQTVGVTKVGSSGERQIGRSRSAPLTCSGTEPSISSHFRDIAL